MKFIPLSLLPLAVVSAGILMLPSCVTYEETLPDPAGTASACPDCLSGTWTADWTTNRGRSGDSRVILNPNGRYEIYENDHHDDRHDHIERGRWNADLNAQTLTISGSWGSVTGSLVNVTENSFVWSFTNLGGETYVYRCRR